MTLPDHYSDEEDDQVEKLIASMSVSDLIGQMSQVDINLLLDKNTGLLDQDTAERYIGTMGVGSVLNVPTAPPKRQWTARQYRSIGAALLKITQRHQRPPVIWGLDSVHGANYVQNAILTPQPLNVAATFNTTVAMVAGQLASRDTRAAGINWLFSPLVGVAVQPLWSRVYETFGEDPLIVGAMAARMVEGIQQEADRGDRETGIPPKAAACGKHWLGYPATRTGHDRAPSWIPTRHLYQYFVPSWKRVLASNVSTVMESYTEVDGVPMVLNHALLQGLLRDRLGFDGVLVTDYEEMYNAAMQWHHAASSKEEAVLQSVQASVDMSMIPWDIDTFHSTLVQAVKDGKLSVERLQTSARRVLRLKQELGMLDKDWTIAGDDTNTVMDNRIGTDQDSVYRGMVHDSLVLANNKANLLPLNRNEKLKLLVTGPTADSLGSQSGGWTWEWQGTDDRSSYSYGSTVRERLEAAGASTTTPWETTYHCGVDILGKDCSDPSVEHDESVLDTIKHWGGFDETPSNSIAKAVHAAAEADVTVICVGEEPSAEKPGDIDSLRLPAGQYDLVEAIRKNTSTQIVLVFFGGRPRILPSDIDTILLGFLPGPDGGRAVVDILTGAVNPSGRLPITYPLSDNLGGVPYWHTVSDQCTASAGEPLPHYAYTSCPVAWPFGHGLSYTSFAYAEFTAVGGIDTDLVLSVSVTNTGSRPGAETVLFFTFDEFRPVTPEYKRLRAFEKIHLGVGETAQVHKTVPIDELRFVGPDSDKHYILDPTMVSYAAVGYQTDCRERDGDGHPVDQEFCRRLQSTAPTKPYFPICETACEVWRKSECLKYYGFSVERCTISCQSMDSSASRWDWNYVDCLEQLRWSTKDESCWRMTQLCRDIFVSTDATGLIHRGEPSSATLLLAMTSALTASLFFVILIGGFVSRLRIRKTGQPTAEFSAIEFSTLQNGTLA